MIFTETAKQLLTLDKKTRNQICELIKIFKQDQKNLTRFPLFIMKTELPPIIDDQFQIDNTFLRKAKLHEMTTIRRYNSGIVNLKNIDQNNILIFNTVLSQILINQLLPDDVTLSSKHLEYLNNLQTEVDTDEIDDLQHLEKNKLIQNKQLTNIARLIVYYSVNDTDIEKTELQKFAEKWKQYNKDNFNKQFNGYKSIIEQLSKNIKNSIELPANENLEEYKFNLIYKKILDFLIASIKLSHNPNRKLHDIQNIINDMKNIVDELCKIKEEDIIYKLSYYEAKIAYYGIIYRYKNLLVNQDKDTLNFNLNFTEIENYHKKLILYLGHIEYSIENNKKEKENIGDGISTILETINSRANLLINAQELFSTSTSS